MAVILTDVASTRIKKFMVEQKNAIGLRLGIRQSGCSGYAYIIEYINETNDDDVIFEEKGVKVVIASDSLSFLDGLELDYGKEGINESFIFNNPNAKAVCGCGDSVSF